MYTYLIFISVTLTFTCLTALFISYVARVFGVRMSMLYTTLIYVCHVVFLLFRRLFNLTNTRIITNHLHSIILSNKTVARSGECTLVS